MIEEFSIDELVSKIREANEAYRLGAPIMSDPEWDELIEQLAKIDPTNELLQEVGYIAKNDSRKEKLPFPMMSMNKCRTIEELFKWIEKHNLQNEEFILTPKLDGCSLCADESNKLAWTRGDGTFGQRSHNHLRAMNDTSINDNIFTYGEAIMPRARFDEKYAETEENPRNTVAGIMNKEDITNKTLDVDYVRYGVVADDMSQFTRKVDILIYLNKHQENKIMYECVKSNKFTTEYFKYLFEQWNKIYEIDGIIVELNLLYKQEELGREKNGNPIFARAYKSDFEEVSGETTILEIVSQISKKGNLFPVIIIPPTRLDGASVTRITGNNFKFIKDNGLGVGAVITLKRSGMVIPKIIEVIKRVDFKMPDVGVPIAWDESGVHLVTLEETNEQKVMFLTSFFKILGVDNVSEGVCQQLFDAGFDTVKKILSASKSDFEKIDRFGERKADIVFTEIQSKMKNVELSKLQHASGKFNNLGSKKLVLLEGLENPKYSDIVSVEGFSDTSAQAYLEGLISYNDFISDLGDLVTVKKTEAVVATSSDMDGLSFVFTGVRRVDLETVIESKGGKISSGISSKVTHLICKDKNSRSSKIIKAESLGITILSVEELEDMLNN